MDKETKVDVDSQEYKDFVEALEIVENDLISLNSKLLTIESESEMDKYSARLNKLLQDRDSICKDDRNTIERVLGESKA